MLFDKNGIYICKSNIGIFLVDITGLDDKMSFKDYDIYLHKYRFGTILSETYFPMQFMKLSDMIDARHIRTEMGFSSDITDEVLEWYGYGMLDWRIVMTRLYQCDKGCTPYDYLIEFRNELLRQYNEANK